MLLASGLASGAGMSTETSATHGFDLQAHRGGRGLRPENTLPAFRHALEIGVSTLELDCAVTKDGVVVVSHDSALNPDITRDANGKFLGATGPSIVTLTFAELERYDVGRLRSGGDYGARFPEQQAVDGTRIPKLADVYALVRRSGNHELRFNVEAKLDPTQPALTLPPQPFVEAMLKVIRESGFASRTIIQSFDWRTLDIVHKLAPQVVTVALTDEQLGEDTIEKGKLGASQWLGGLDVDDYGGSVPRLVKANGSQVWSPNALDLNAGVVAEAHALGLKVIPWTVNDPKDMERVLALGVDGMISDRPDLLRSVLEAKGLAVPRPTPVR